MVDWSGTWSAGQADLIAYLATTLLIIGICSAMGLACLIEPLLRRWFGRGRRMTEREWVRAQLEAVVVASQEVTPGDGCAEWTAHLPAAPIPATPPTRPIAPSLRQPGQAPVERPDRGPARKTAWDWLATGRIRRSEVLLWDGVDFVRVRDLQRWYAVQGKTAQN